MAERLTEKERKVFSEVDLIISRLEPSLQDRVPQKIKNYISKSKLSGYEPKFNEDIPIFEQKFSKNAMSLMALIYLKYICTSEENRAYVRKFLGYKK